ncbi:ABC transporter permease [Latilactobacillus sakei]|uniref:ABC-2 family transporter protein n=1 Tax=Latilactobacillus sakei TaxID=1599 RepID=A0AAE8J496_LATSK|nr:ABC transporter permease [Latilactobacillus sakei]AWZ44189.1 ABC transporter permease [Latilactobacillus sakei]MCB4408715.1 ABC transporter permease [Latilactobacillus sakei]MDN4008977.1 ABC transporter permease [Latilactobacillus sakei]UNC18780.1 ABC transporter permease [Latilactobacillus sakei]USS37784.1 ABC transporter permease [Latilactobacillus sakei]
MQTALSQEYYKLLHKKLTWFAPGIIVGLMLLMPLTFNDPHWLVMANFGSSQWILLVLVIVGATLFSMEIQHNTILTLLYKAPNRRIIYLAKLIVLFGYNIVLHLFALGLTILFNTLAIGGHANWLTTYQYHQSLLTNTIMTATIDLGMSLMLIGFLFLLSCLLTNNAVVITTSITIVFMGQALSSKLLNEHPQFGSWLKFNPLNMLNLTFQYANYPVYHKLTQLTNGQLLLGTLGYAVLFLWLGNWCFKRRHF